MRTGVHTCVALRVAVSPLFSFRTPAENVAGPTSYQGTDSQGDVGALFSPFHLRLSHIPSVSHTWRHPGCRLSVPVPCPMERQNVTAAFLDRLNPDLQVGPCKEKLQVGRGEGIIKPSSSFRICFTVLIFWMATN